MDGYASAQDISESWGVTKRRVQYLCEHNRIPGAVRIGNMWVIPSNAVKPKDARLRCSSTKAIPIGSAIRKARKALKSIVDKSVNELNSQGLSAADAIHTLIIVFSSELLSAYGLGINSSVQICEDFFGYSITDSLSDEGTERIRRFISENEQCLDDSLSWVYQFATKKSESFPYKDTQFFTEKYMIKALVDAIPLREESVIADPACGGGNFLLYAFDKLIGERIPDDNIDTVIDDALCRLLGYEIDRSLAYVAAFNLVLKSVSLISAVRPITVTDVIAIRPRIYHPLCESIPGFLDVNWEQQLVTQCVTNEPVPFSAVFENVDVIVTNPPFQTIKGMPSRLKDYLQRYYPDSKCDLCNAFIERILDILPVCGSAGLVTQNSWMYLDSFTGLRRKILKEYTISRIWELGANAFYDLSGEKANVALVSFLKKGPDNNHEIALCQLRYENIESIENAIDNECPDPMLVKQCDVCNNMASRFDMISTDHLKTIQARCDQYKEYAVPMQGTSTGDAKNLIDYYWRHVNEKEWVLVSKGGGYSRFQGLNSYCVRWGDDGEYIKRTKGSAIRNANYFDQTQLVFSDTGTAGLNVRVLLPSQIFVASGPGIRVLKGKPYAHLAFLNSRFAAFFVRLMSPKLTIAAGYIGQIPVTERLLDSVTLEENARQCLRFKEHRLSKRPSNIEFMYVQHPEQVRIIDAAEAWFVEDLEDEWQQLVCEQAIESEIYQEMMLDDADMRAIEDYIGKRVIFDDHSSDALNIGSESDLSGVLGPDCLPRRTKASKKALGTDGLIEYFAQIKGVPCECAYYALRQNYQWVTNSYLDLYMHALIVSATEYREGIADAIDMDTIISKMGKIRADEITFVRNWITEKFNRVHYLAFDGKPLFEYHPEEKSFIRVKE